MSKIQVRCNDCSAVFSIETEDSFFAFNCRQCNAIYVYSKNESDIKIEKVRAGISIPVHIRKAFEVLELPIFHSSEEMLKKARRKQIELYHPDKVNSLGKEFIDLANSKTKEINEAYDLVRNWLNNKSTLNMVAHDKKEESRKKQDGNLVKQWQCPKCKTANANESFICKTCGSVNNKQWEKMK